MIDLRRARAIDDPATLEHLAAVSSAPNFLPLSLRDAKINDRFLERYCEWVRCSRHNRLQGIDEFRSVCYSQGSTESFNLFYAKHKDRRMRCFRGEYFYHQICWRNHFPNWSFVDDDPISSRDVFVVSVPFADTGEVHSKLEEVLERCDQLGVPTLIDCTYFGLCRNVQFDFGRPCIDTVTFCLSKAFPLAHARVGMRLTRKDDDDPLFFMNKENYTNRIGASLGFAFIEKFSADYNQNRWRKRQVSVCEELGITASDTVIFGLGGESFSQYSRVGLANRLCLNDYYEKDIPATP